MPSALPTRADLPDHEFRSRERPGFWSEWPWQSLGRFLGSGSMKPFTISGLPLPCATAQLCNPWLGLSGEQLPGCGRVSGWQANPSGHQQHHRKPWRQALASLARKAGRRDRAHQGSRSFIWICLAYLAEKYLRPFLLPHRQPREVTPD